MPVTAPGSKPAPIARRSLAPGPIAPEGVSAPGRLVLAIDDDEDFLALLRASVAGTPIRLQCALGGPGGLEMARQLRPDAITWT